MKTLTVLAILLVLQAPKQCSKTPPLPPPPPPAEHVLFQSNFERGNFSDWDSLWNPCCIAINSDSRFVHFGSQSAKFHYQIGANEGEAHQDSNLYIEKDFPNGLTHFAVSGYVYFKSPEPGGSKDLQRKIYYFKDPQGPNGTPAYNYAIGLTSFATPTTNHKITLSMFRWSSQHQQEEDWGTPLEYDRWYLIKMEVDIGTPQPPPFAHPDGRYRVSVDGVQVIDSGPINIRDNYPTKIVTVEIGRQADRGSFLPVDEYRYWNEIKIVDIN